MKDESRFLIETVKQGNFLKISAFDAETLQEVSMMAPVNSCPTYLQKLILRKMEMVKRKNS